jgi:RNA chaperone Hfq
MANQPEPTKRGNPEVEQLRTWKEQKTKLYLKLTDGTTLVGQLSWFSNYTIMLATESEQYLLPKHAILFYRPAQEGEKTEEVR